MSPRASSRVRCVLNFAVASQGAAVTAEEHASARTTALNILPKENMMNGLAAFAKGRGL